MARKWTHIHFGKYEGQILPLVLFKDADYFFWCYDQDYFHSDLGLDAERLYRRATSIRIPDRYGADVAIEYIVGPSGRFEELRVVPANLALDGGGSRSYLKRTINMRVPYALHNYDKGGGKLFIRCMKDVLFGNPSYRMTAQSAADFFDEDSNFVLGETP